MANQEKAIELVLSILLAVSFSYAMTMFVDFGSSTWLFLSLFSIVITISLIYFLLNIKVQKMREYFMLASFGLGILLPYSLKKMLSFYNSMTKETDNWWSIGAFLVHLGILGILMILWGAFSKEGERKGKIVAGIIVIILTLFTLLLKSNQVLNVGGIK